MNFVQIEKIAEAVLYEGYSLYPYRPSSVKNQQRWNFGVLYPLSFCEGQAGSDRDRMQTECLLRATAATRLTVKVRFLHICGRLIGKVREEGAEIAEGEEPAFELVNRLEVAGRVHVPWQEAMEREVSINGLDLQSQPRSTVRIDFPEGRTVEHLRDAGGRIAGVIVREWHAVSGVVEVESEQLRDGAIKVTVRVENLSDGGPQRSARAVDREAVLLDSLVSAHTILGAEEGEFISLLDPPRGFEDLVEQCKNVGTWPVLAGDDASGVLSSPIILYDYPQIAPESAGNLFDSTEIDEILSLRILTLTEEEKREMRQSDDRTRGILERTENMPEEQFMKLHGVLRGLSVLKEETP
jgi:hypothetical protein